MDTSSTKKQKVRHPKEESKSFKLNWDIEKSLFDVKLMNFITRREKR